MQGRMGRAHFVLANALPLAFLIAAIIAGFTPFAPVIAHSLEQPHPVTVILGLTLGAFLLWVLMASEICRLHDIGQTGLWVVLNLIPGAALLIFLFLMFSKGEDGANRFGAPPLMS